MRRLAAGVILLTLVMLVGCSPEKNLGDADNATAAFHAQYNASQFDAIYRDADDTFRSATSKNDFDRFIGAVRRKLGAQTSSERKTWNIFVGTGGAKITATYTTKFQYGTGDEQFVWHRTGSGMKLIGWHINSNDLIIR